jgi:hypothetical protein
VSWTWLGIALVVSVLYALMAPKLRGTRPVGRTRLMAVARVVFLLIILALFYMAFVRRL